MLNNYSLGLVTLLSVVASAACTSSESDESFDYGRDDMRSAIEGTWEGTSLLADGSAGSPVTLSIVYSTPDAKTLCASRVLGRHEPGAVAPRCVATSSMNITGTMTARFGSTDAPRDLPVRGTFDVMSLKLDGRGTLSAEVNDRRLEATLSNEVLEGNLSRQADASSLGFSLRRRK
jgi:hypothetical protein